LNGHGDFIWKKTFGGVDWDDCYGLAVDGENSVYVTGKFYGNVDFNPGTGTTILSGQGPLPYSSDIFVQKLDSTGNLVWVYRIGSAVSGLEQGNGIVVDGHNNIYVCGVFYGTSDFDPGSAVYNLIPSGGAEAFVLKWNGFLSPVGLKTLVYNESVGYPNPFTNVIRIRSQDQIREVKIFDTLGNEIEIPPVKEYGEYVFDLSAMSSGAYFIGIINQDNVRQVLKVIKM
jgi:hypothetical protein